MTAQQNQYLSDKILAFFRTVLFIGLLVCYSEDKERAKGVSTMDHTPCLAHITDDGRTQTVLTHLLETASLARTFAQPFGGESQAELAGLSHDIGKYSAAFQRRLHGGPRTDHATAGAAECWQRRQPFAAFAVAGHHGGLPDGGGQGDGPELATLCVRLKRKKRNLL